jgi:hypothetical protein
MVSATITAAVLEILRSKARAYLICLKKANRAGEVPEAKDLKKLFAELSTAHSEYLQMTENKEVASPPTTGATKSTK